MLLIGRTAREFASTNQKQHPDLGSDTSSVWNFYNRLSDFISVMALRNVGCFLKLEIAPCENNEEEVYSFQWSHQEMLFTDTNVTDLGSANAH